MRLERVSGNHLLPDLEIGVGPNRGNVNRETWKTLFGHCSRHCFPNTYALCTTLRCIVDFTAQREEERTKRKSLVRSSIDEMAEKEKERDERGRAFGKGEGREEKDRKKGRKEEEEEGRTSSGLSTEDLGEGKEEEEEERKRKVRDKENE
ncbi:unnamed protein product [Dovyalis caffra]|uniref:Uncharacterized protein n=1 Tax=Dovyalis caffra TaxID=77055 RepID=A0AAV1QRS1_9ROSI|nr:unnamed protein product [Dovyalis caffra]